MNSKIFLDKSAKFIVILLAGLFFSGCTDSRYLAEKLLWKAERKVAEIIKDKGGNLSDKEVNEVVSIYREVINACPLEPVSAEIHLKIAGIYLAKGNPAEAQNELKAIVNNFSSNSRISSQAQFAIGRIFESQKQWDKARDEYEKISDLYPTTPLGLKMPLYFVRYYKSIEDSVEEEKAYKSALRHYESLLKQYEGTPFAPMIEEHLALAYLQRGNKDEAMEIWNNIIDTYPESQQAAMSILTKADLLSRSKETISEAVQVYGDFMKKYPQSKNMAGIKLKVGLLYLIDGKLDEAKDSFEEILDSYSNNEEVSIKAYLALANYHKKTGSTEDIINILNTIKQKYPKSETALSVPVLISKYYEEIDAVSQADAAYAEAITGYKNIVESAKNNSALVQKAANFLAFCYIKQGQADKAENVFLELTKKFPKDPRYLIDLALVYSKLNIRDKAVAVYESLIEKYPDNKMIAKLAANQIKLLKEKIED